MPAAAHEDHTENRLQELAYKLETGALFQVRGMIKSLRPAEISYVLEALRPADRKIVWRLVDPELAGEILVELNDEVRNGLIEATDARDLVNAAESMETDDLADILDDFPDVVLKEVLRSMGNQDRQRLETVLCFDDDSAGGLMNVDTVTVRSDVSLDVVLRYLRLRGEIPELTDSLIVVDRKDCYLGVLFLSVLLTSEAHKTVKELMATNVEAIPVDFSASEVALLFEQRDLVSAPVVDRNDKLLGRITIDDVVDVIRDEADHSLMSMAGLDEEQDMFAPVLLTTKRRAVWLGVNLLTALLASWVIGVFESTIEKVVALAVLMPIVASMGGIAGSQTLTLVIRGLALRQIGKSNARILVLKELAVGVLNGLVWAVVVTVIAMLWFDNMQIGALIGVALAINLICAALAGAVIPLFLHRLKIDPALAGGVLLTTVTDVIGFWVFLGLATAYLV